MPMVTNNGNNDKYQKLIKAYPIFIYEGFRAIEDKEKFNIIYEFEVPGLTKFQPTISIPKKKLNFIVSPLDENLSGLIFSAGLAELPSYWKATCSPTVVVKAGYLDNIQINWWKEFYLLSLGEFFYVNKIEVDKDNFINFVIESNKKYEVGNFSTYDHIIVPVGGGKDSAVTCEIIRRNKLPFNCLIVNPRKASVSVAEVAGISKTNVCEIYRTIDNNLLQLNEKGFLNGHTPFSAVLAFYSALFSILIGSKHIALSNESSANEPTIPNTKINHQFSKTYEFELMFRNYLYNYISKDINYFSLLRPLNELQIASIFSRYEAYHSVFKSCNVGSKEDIWCCKCPKCLFTFVILSPFIGIDKLISIFGTNLLDDEDLMNIFLQLCGLSENKPFDCIGTVTEINIALCNTVNHYSGKLPFLLDYYTKTEKYRQFKNVGTRYFMNFFDNRHFLLPEFSKLVQNAISEINNQ